MKFEEFHVDQVFTTEKQKLAIEEMKQFAEKYDPQAIHLDPFYAKKANFKDIIASGFLTMSIGWNLWIRTNIFGDDSQGGLGMDEIQFLAPVYPNDLIFTEVTILDLRPSTKHPNLGIVTFSFNIKNHRDEFVYKSKIAGLLNRKQEETS